MLGSVSEKWSKWLPYLFMVLAACSRWPGLFPPNFSAFYGLAFCAGAFFPRTIRWWLPLATLILSDVVLNCYYLFALHINAFKWTQLVNYAAFLGVIGLGTRFSRRSSFLRLLSGGLLGAILFYLVTNTVSWLTDPAYSKDLAGWFVALTTGRNGFPTTLEFFRNTLLSGGLFTGLFAGAMKLTEAAEPATEEEAEEEPARAPEAEPEPEAGEA
jgi:hypothetical protein